MWRNLTRYYDAGDLHFIPCSCYARQPLLGTAPRRDLFLQVLEQVRRRYQKLPHKSFWEGHGFSRAAESQ